MSKPKKCKKCPIKCGKPIKQEILTALEEGLEKLMKSDSTSLLKRFFTKEILEKLKMKKTYYGATLLECVNSGLENHHSEIGIYAADPESYELYADLFVPIIEEYHKIRRARDKHPPSNWGTVTELKNLDPRGKYIVSTRVKISRNLKGFPFNGRMSENNYVDIEIKLWGALRGLKGELKGDYHPLTGMPQRIQKIYIAEHFLFRENNRFLQAADACRFWPFGRGIFYNHIRNFLVWVNEEDHVRLMSMQPGGDLGAVLKRLLTGLNYLEKRMEFLTHERYGYLTSCPSLLGNTIRACVRIKVPNLAADDMPKLQELADQYKIKLREIAGEDDNVDNPSEGVFELRNARRFGCTEYKCLKRLYDGIAEIILAEKRAAKLKAIKNIEETSKVDDS